MSRRSTAVAVLVAAVAVAVLVAAASVHAALLENSDDVERESARLGSVLLAGDRFVFVDGIMDRNAVAFGSYADTLDSIGWGILRIETNGAYDDLVQARAAGVLEGAFTGARIKEMATNLLHNVYGGAVPQYVVDFVDVQMKFYRDMSTRSHPTADERTYWRAAHILLQQFDGLVEGATTITPPANRPTPWEVLLINGESDFHDLVGILRPNQTHTLGDHDNDDLPDAEKIKLTDCSSLVRLTNDFTDVFAGHNTWWDYAAMHRIYKVYRFAFKTVLQAHEREFTVAFSAYPGNLVSTDDYYVTSRKLTVMETTNSVYNHDLHKLVKPESVLSWQRAYIANLLAHTGAAWTSLFKRYNSGSYNNQWIIVDFKALTPGKQPQPGSGLLWIQEVVPGLTVERDMTDYLVQHGHWQSYNIPFFPEIYNISGYPAAYEKYGAQVSWSDCPRGRIFTRDANNVNSFDDAKHFMRYNNYQNDPLTNNDPLDSICARGDLEPTVPGKSKPASWGGIDAKVTSYKHIMQSLTSSIISGPSTEGGLPVFKWSDFAEQFKDVSHVGLPNEWNFDWIDVSA